MSSEITKIRALQRQTQEAFAKAEEANNAGAMSELEAVFDDLVRTEARLLATGFAGAAADIASIADRLDRATQDINNKIATFFVDDIKAVAEDLAQDATALFEEEREATADVATDDTPAEDTPAVETPAEGTPTLDVPASGTTVPKTKASYVKRYAEIELRESKMGDIDRTVDLITKAANMTRYRAVEQATGVPHWVVGILHMMEASLNFKSHLHNGDPLSAPTVRVPAGRPKHWRAGMSWAESAADALVGGGRNLNEVSDWSVGAALEIFERYNGLGYRNRNLMSPYLWAGSTYYDKGKFVSDETFDPEAGTKQIGAAVLLKRMEEREIVSVSKAKASVSVLPAGLVDSPEPQSLGLNIPELKHALAEIEFPGQSANARIKVGQQGMTARRIQEWCSLHGISTSIDNDFGGATEKSVRRFQREKNLEDTGEVDRNTWTLLTDPMRNALRPIEGVSDFSELLLKIARQHVAQNPTERGGNNFGPWVRLYMRGKQGENQLWCAGFVCTLAALAARDMAIKMPIKRQVGVDTLVSDAKNDGRFLSETRLPNPALRPSLVKPGMMFMVRKTATDWNHVGLVTKAGTDIFNTIEGNTNGSNNDGGQAKASTRSYRNKDFVTFF